jgi:4-amino-4-deoxy-L-arabinose transferase-like glycosyltransferase
MRHAPTLLYAGAVLTLAAALRLFYLGQNGYSREYYAAAVRSMLESWHNTFFNSFDPGGFVSLDKPPVGIWIQALFAKLFGFSAINSLLPQVVLGLAAILLVYILVRRVFGEAAALLAAAALAVSPANVAVDRSNNLESCLIVVLLMALWFAMRAAETGRLRHLAAAMLMIGIGFNVKMAAALVIAPPIALVFFLFNRQHSLQRHVVYLSVAGAAMIAVALSWIVAFDLTPADKRPYAGSTSGNSMIELALKHNGSDRFRSPTAAADPARSQQPQPELYDTSPVGPLRLFRALQAGQFAWLLPLAVAAVLLAWTNASREQRIALSLWCGWLASYWIVFSTAGGPFHTYYLAALAPPVAALAGIGAVEAWSRIKAGNHAVFLTVILLTLLWQGWLFAGQTGYGAPVWLSVLASAAAGLAVVCAIFVFRAHQAKRAALAALSFSALLALPLLAALSVVLIRPNTIAPVATLAEFSGSQQNDAARADPRRRDLARAKLVAFLNENRGPEKFIVAVENALNAAPIIIATGAPVMTMGGYLGTDPILTPQKLALLRAQGVVRFAMIGGLSLTKRDKPQEAALHDWVRENGTRVDPGLWSTAPELAGKSFNIRLGGALTQMVFPEVYDLRFVNR